MSERSKRRFFAAAFAAAFVLLGATPALAHEERAVGDLDMEAGWGTEPALAGQMNSALLLLAHDGEPVVDLGDLLEFEVTFGDRTQKFPIEPFFEADQGGTPGEYRAWFIPTQPGEYTFRFSGTIDGEDIEETFTPGAGGFEEVESPQPIQFPEQEPSTGELAARLEREVPRLTSSVDDVRASAQAAADDASSAKTLGLAGLVVGAAGLVVAIVALVASRRRKAA